MSTIPISTFEEPTEINIYSKNGFSSEQTVCTRSLEDFLYISDPDVEIANCNIYIPPTCLLSRHDIKKYCELYNCKRVLNYNKADYIILNNTYYPEATVINVYSNISGNKIYTYKRVYTSFIGYNYNGYRHVYIYPDDYLHLMNNKDKLVGSKNILTKLYNSADLTIIDEKFYITLDSMFNSNTEEEITLAVSLMENCNIRKSLMYLMLLISKHRSEIYYYDLQERVKFASMFNFIVNHDVNFDKFNHKYFFEILERHNCLTRYNINILMKYVKTYAEINLKDEFETYDLIVKLSLSDSMINKIKENEVNPNQLSLFQDGTN